MKAKKREAWVVLILTILLAAGLVVGWKLGMGGIVAGALIGVGISPSFLESWEFAIGSGLVFFIAMIIPFWAVIKNSRQLQSLERMLQEERRGSRAFLEIADVVFVVIDAKQEVVLINPKGCEVLGHSKDKILGRDWINAFVPAKFRNSLRKVIEEIPRGKENRVQYLKSPLLGKNGQERWFEWQITHMQDDNGNITATLCSGRDLSEKQRLEKDLQAVQTKYDQQIRKLSSDLVMTNKRLQRQKVERQRTQYKLNFWIEIEKLIAPLSTNRTDLSQEEIDAIINGVLEKFGTTTRVNQAYVFLFTDDQTAMTNTHTWPARAENEGVPTDEAIPLDYFPWFKEKIMKLETIHVPNVEALPEEAANEKNIFQSQGVRSFLNVPMTYAGAPIGYIGFESEKEKTWREEDIALLKILGDLFASALGFTKAQKETRVQEKIQEIQEKFHPDKFSESLLNENTNGTLAFDRDFHVIEWNPVMEKISGLSKSEALGQPVFDLLPFIKSTEEEQYFRDAIEGKRNVARERSYPFPGKETPGFFETHYSPLVGESGEIVGGLVIIQDLTELKKIEEELLQAQSTLETQAKQVSEEAQAARDGLESEIEARNQTENEMQAAQETLEKQVKELTEELETVRSGMQYEIDLRKQIEEEIQTAREEHKAQIDQITAELEEARSQLETKLEPHQAEERAALETRVQQLTQDLEAAQAGLQTEQESRARIEEEMRAAREILENQVGDLTRKMEETESQLQAEIETRMQFEEEMNTAREVHETRVRQLTEELEETQAKLQAELEARSQAEEEIDSATQTLNERIKELTEELEAAKSALKFEVDIRNQTEAEMQELRAIHENRINEIRQELEAAQSNLQAEKENRVRIEQNIQTAQEALETRIQELTVELEASKTRLETEVNSKNGFAEEKLALQEEHARQTQQLRDDLETAQSRLQAELDSRIHLEEELKTSRETYESRVSQLTGELEQAQARLQSELDARNQLEEEMSAARQAHEARVLQFTGEMEEIQARLQSELETRNRLEEELKTSRENYESRVNQLSGELEQTQAQLQSELDARNRIEEDMRSSREAWETQMAEMTRQSEEAKESFYSEMRDQRTAFETALSQVQADLSERQNEVSRLLQKEKHHTFLSDHSGLIIGFLSPEYRILDFNQGAEKVLGWEKDSTLNSGFFDLVLGEENRAGIRQQVTEGLAANISTGFESELLLADSGKHYFRWSVLKQEEEEGNAQGGYLVIGRDITDTRQASKALEENERLLHSLTENALDGMITFDQRGVVRSLNAAAERIFGYNSADVTGQTLNVLLPQPIRTGAPASNMDYFLPEGGGHVRPGPQETVGKRKDGSTFPVEVSTSEFYQDNQPFTLCIVRDLTLQKQLEQGLKDTEEKYRRFFSAESDAVIIWDAASKQCVDANDSALKLYGFSREEFLKLNASSISMDPGKDPAMSDALLPGQIHTTPLGYQKKQDGTIFPAEIISTTFKSQNQSRTLWLVKDVTHTNQLKEELKSTEEKLRMILGHIQAVVYVKDLEGRYIMINRAFETLFNITNEHISGKVDHDIFPAEIADELQTLDRKVIDTGKPLESETSVFHNDGLHTYHSVKFPLRNASGVIYGVCSIATDITDRRAKEEELKNYRSQLGDMIAERTAEIQTQHEQRLQKEKLASINQLSSSVARKVSNPIEGIRNILEQIGEKVPMEEFFKGLLDLGVKECNRVSDLVDKLQECDPSPPREPEATDVHRTLDEIISHSQARLADRNIELETHFAADLPQILADPEKIRESILNILRNAEEAIPQDTKGKIRITTESHNARIKIHIQDNGCGIPPKNLKSIFEPFFTTKSADNRNGLGLAISLGIIKKHGGEIDVQSQPAMGTTVTITLPTGDPAVKDDLETSAPIRQEPV